MVAHLEVTIGSGDTFQLKEESHGLGWKITDTTLDLMDTSKFVYRVRNRPEVKDGFISGRFCSVREAAKYLSMMSGDWAVYGITSVVEL